MRFGSKFNFQLVPPYKIILLKYQKQIRLNILFDISSNDEIFNYGYLLLRRRRRTGLGRLVCFTGLLQLAVFQVASGY